MAIFRVQVFYSMGALGKWSNVYHADGTSLADVLSAFQDNMQEPLRTLLHVQGILEKVLISSTTDDTFLEAPILLGGANGDTEQVMPLFNSIKVFFQTDALGRPDYKFVKGTLTDDANEGGFVASSVVTGVRSAYLDIISDMSTASAPLVSESGDLWTDVAVQTLIQMRQLHRRRRRTTPTP